MNSCFNCKYAEIVERDGYLQNDKEVIDCLCSDAQKFVKAIESCADNFSQRFAEGKLAIFCSNYKGV